MPREIAFIDESIPELATFLAGLRPDVEAIVLSPASSAPEQIARGLRDRAELDAIHIVAHGAAGEVGFASGALTLETLQKHAAYLPKIGDALAPAGDLMLWSCETGKGERGLEFIKALGPATGASVSAATTFVGCCERDSRWELGVGRGVKAGPLKAEAAASYAGVLGTIDLNTTTPGINDTSSYPEGDGSTLLFGSATIDPGFLVWIYRIDVIATAGSSTQSLTVTDIPSGFTVQELSQSYLSIFDPNDLRDTPTWIRMLNSIEFNDSANENPSATIPIVVNVYFTNPFDDFATATETINITPHNNAPTAAIAQTFYSTAQQTPLSLKGTGLSIADVDANDGSMTAILQVTTGQLLASAGGSHATVNGNGSTSLQITGTLAEINAFLNTDPQSSLSYLNPSPGSTTLTLTVHDNGYTGGVDRVASDSANINIIETTAPTVVSIVPTDSSPTNAGTVHYLVTFSEPVTGLNASQFTLVTTGVSGATIVGVQNFPSPPPPGGGSGSNLPQYPVTINTGSGDGTLALQVTGTGIHDLAGNALVPVVYGSEATYATEGRGPVAIGDLNGDGKPDIVASNTGSDSVSVLLGNGNGTFQPQVTYATGDWPLGVAIGDLNGDGKPDVVTANYSPTSFPSASVSVLLGNGDGTFETQVPFATGMAPYDALIGDLNRDGKPDIVTVNPYTNSIWALLGNGNGTFQAPISYATQDFPNQVVIGDLNGDGNIDIVTSNGGSKTVSVLLGNGNGTFQTQVAYATAQVDGGVQGVTVGDVNGDGKPDIVAGNSNNSGSSSVSVLLGNGNGTFQSQVAYPTGEFPGFIEIADVNRDGRSDIVTAGSSAISALLGNGNGTFQLPISIATGVSAIFDIGDLNGDGKPDIVAPNQFSNSVLVLVNAATTSAAYIIDKSAPSAPAITNFSPDTGTNPSDGVTKASLVTVRGTAEANSSVTVYNGGILAGAATVDGSGAWHVDNVTLAQGTNSLTARASDMAGNTGPSSAAFMATLDTAPPAAPTLVLALDSGSSDSDGITNSSLINVTGLESGASWQYSTNSGQSWTPGIGSSLTLSVDGAYSVLAVQTDVAGNTSTPSVFAATLDTLGPSSWQFTLAANSSFNGTSAIAAGTALGAVTATDSISAAFKYFFASDAAGTAPTQNLNGLSIDRDSGLISAAAAINSASSTWLIAQDLAGNSFAKQFIVNVGTSAGNTATVPNGTTVTFALGGGDTITGTSGSDAIAAGSGNDDIVGFVGADTVDGGAGADRISLLSTSGDLNAAADAQIRNMEIISAIGAGVSVTIDLHNQSEDFDVRGSGSADVITGASGDDVISAGGGDDTIVGFVGADIVTGAGGFDTIKLTTTSDDLNQALNTQIVGIEAVSAAGEAAGVSIDLSRQSEGFRIAGTDFADTITGSSGGDSIVGFVRSDTVDGGAGTDTIVLPATSLDLNSALDPKISGIEAVSAAGAISSVNIDLSLQNEGFTITGSNFADTIGGGAGNDRLVGLDGDDTYYVNSSSDVVTEAANAGIDTVFATGASFTLGANVEKLIFVGIGDFTGTGNALANSITGGAGADQLSGAGSDDILTGLAGHDALSGGAGNDTFLATVGDGDDTYTGNGGTDTYSLAGTTANATVNLAAGTASSSATGSDTLASIENVIGSAGSDTITADTAANVFTGGAGSDTFVFASTGTAGISSGRDQITDFSSADKIDVSGIDANGNQAGDPPFAFVGEILTVSGGLGQLGRGQLGYHYETDTSGAEHTIVEGNINANAAADFQIALAGQHVLTGSEFIL